MGYALLKHQNEGVDFLIDRGVGLLAFEQGLGKTYVAIEAFKRLLVEGRANRLIVICPNSLKRNWIAEFKKFASMMSVDLAEGPPRTRRAIFWESRAEVIITSYETARSEATSLIALAQRQQTVLVLDESHAAKNWNSQTSIAARSVAPYCTFRWLLSGTPVTNTAKDLFTQIEIIKPGCKLLGSLESFTARLIGDPSASFASEVIDRLVLRRTKEQCLDLPAKTFMDIRVELHPWQQTLYDEMRDKMVCEIESMSGEQYRAFAPTALARLTRLIQLACNPALVLTTQDKVPTKFETLDGLVQDILSVPERKVIIWSNYIGSIEALLDRFNDSVAIYGGTTESERQIIATRFQEDPDTRVLIANPAAAGTGFTFTAANFAIYESLSWRYDHYSQSQDRNHRIGQNLPVTYLRLIAVDTIEEAIIASLERKSVLARSLLGDTSGGDAITQLNKDEMCELLRSNRLPNGL